MTPLNNKAPFRTLMLNSISPNYPQTGGIDFRLLSIWLTLGYVVNFQPPSLWGELLLIFQLLPFWLRLRVINDDYKIMLLTESMKCFLRFLFCIYYFYHLLIYVYMCKIFLLTSYYNIYFFFVKCFLTSTYWNLWFLRPHIDCLTPCVFLSSKAVQKRPISLGLYACPKKQVFRPVYIIYLLNQTLRQHGHHI